MDAMPSGSSFARRRAWTNLRIKRSGRSWSDGREPSGVDARVTTAGIVCSPAHERRVAKKAVNGHQPAQGGHGAAALSLSPSISPVVAAFIVWP